MEDNFLSISRDKTFSSPIIAKNKFERVKQECKENNFEIVIVASDEQRKKLKRERKKMKDIARLKVDTEKLKREIIMGKRTRILNEKD